MLSNMSQLTVIKTFTFPLEASVMRSFLDANGIQTFIQNEINAQVDPLLSNALGGIQLLVPSDQFELAVKLVQSNGFDLGKKPKDNKLRAWINKLMGD